MSFLINNLVSLIKARSESLKYDFNLIKEFMKFIQTFIRHRDNQYLKASDVISLTKI